METVRKVLGRDAIRAARPALPRDVVMVPEIEAGAAVLVQGLSGSGRDAYEASLLSDRGNGRGKGQKYALDNVRARLIVRCVIDPDTGDRVFTDEDVAAVGAWPASVIHRVFEAAKKLSGMSDAEVEELGKLSAGDLSDS